ncbi:hypothetical protein GIB67_039633 [Kingdonia uniflora]|uniref:Uncharacterized protein n=1 Tax=Kingdonia uniflora TaxID=39325 RepID=A0A7J7MDF7_9MAGN|nr:hypothetical protein GIB67_039633 [Kingdonia uniflora]
MLSRFVEVGSVRRLGVFARSLESFEVDIAVDLREHLFECLGFVEDECVYSDFSIFVEGELGDEELRFKVCVVIFAELEGTEIGGRGRLVMSMVAGSNVWYIFSIALPDSVSSGTTFAESVFDRPRRHKKLSHQEWARLHDYCPGFLVAAFITGIPVTVAERPINAPSNPFELAASLITLLLFERSVKGYLLLCAEPFSKVYLLLCADPFSKVYLPSRLRLQEFLEGIDSELR